MIGVLRRRGVARLIGAGLASEVGDWLLLIALPLFVLDLTGSAFVTATVFVLELLPSVVFAPVAGVLADRYDRWRLIGVVATIQAVALIPLIAVDSVRELWIVYLVVVVESLLGTIIEPARAAAASALVDESELLSLNGILGITSSLSRLVGGPAGGLLYGLTGLTGVILVDAASFLVAAALVVTGHASGATAPGSPDSGSAPAAGGSGLRGMVTDWREGLRFITASAALRRVLAVTAVMGLAQGAFLVLFVLFVVRDVSGAAADVGLLRGVQAIGALAGGAVLAVLARRIRPVPLLAGSLIFFGVVSLGTWNLPNLTVEFGWYVALFIIVGVPSVIGLTSLMTLLQMHAPDRVRGRVLSAFFAVYGALQALGMLLSGVVGTGAGLTATLQVQGGLYLLAGLLALALRRHQTGTSAQATSAAVPEVIESKSA